MSLLIDTNVISEVRKGRRCHAKVAEWYAGVDEGDLFLSVVVLGEIRKGVETARPTDPAKAEALDTWLDGIGEAFAARILPVDVEVADEWGRLSALRTIPVADALMAATARVHRLTLVTRNVRHLAGLSVRLLNPFE